MPVSVADAAHLLRRSGFGVTQAQIDELTKLSSRNAAVDRVLDLSLVPPAVSPISNAYVDDQFTAWYSATDWWLERMRTTPVPIVEKMTLFWHNHFVSGLGNLFDMGLLFQQNQLLRQHALGDFHAMAQAVSIDPAMLYYLDNVFNNVWAPQENFARELLELFTLGVGQYTQDDVVSMARAWTGHCVDDSLRAYQFRSTWHDSGPKQLFGLPAQNWDGPAALTEVLKGSKAVTSSRFITAKLFSYLAYPVTATDPVVVSLADGFRATNLNIMSLVKAIFRSTAFWSTTARRALVRTPVEWFVAGMQATKLNTSTCVPEYWMERTGQILFGAPDVSGWKQNDYWLSTSDTWGRSSWASHVAPYAWKGGLFAGFENMTATTAVAAGFKQFGITEPSAVTRAALETWFKRAKAEGDGWSIGTTLALLLLLSPDFQLA